MILFEATLLAVFLIYGVVCAMLYKPLAVLYRSSKLPLLRIVVDTLYVLAAVCVFYLIDFFLNSGKLNIFIVTIAILPSILINFKNKKNIAKKIDKTP